MTIKKSDARFPVQVSQEHKKKLEASAKERGLSLSKYCAAILKKHVMVADIMELGSAPNS